MITNYNGSLNYVFASHQDPTVRMATSSISPKLTLKVTRQKPLDKRDHAETFIVTYGRPNYAERQFIKDCVAAGEPFPIRKVQVRRWPVPK